jgi:hypothetical protein
MIDMNFNDVKVYPKFDILPVNEKSLVQLVSLLNQSPLEFNDKADYYKKLIVEMIGSYSSQNVDPDDIELNPEWGKANKGQSTSNMLTHNDNTDNKAVAPKASSILTNQPGAGVSAKQGM